MTTSTDADRERAQQLLTALKGPVRLGHSQRSFDRGVEQILHVLADAYERGRVVQRERDANRLPDPEPIQVAMDSTDACDQAYFAGWRDGQGAMQYAIRTQKEPPPERDSDMK